MSMTDDPKYRHQMVIPFGTGEAGKSIRDAIDQAAREEGIPPTVWARRTLLEKLGLAIPCKTCGKY